MRRLWQFVAAVIFFATVMLPALQYWSPKVSIWVFKSFVITLPLAARLVLAAVGGAVAAAIATPRRRLRTIGAICGILGGLGAFGLSWGYLRLMVRFQRESVFSSEIILMTLLGAVPAYFLYDLLERRQDNFAKNKSRAPRI